MNKLYCDFCWTASHRHQINSNHVKIEWTNSSLSLLCSDHRDICDKYCNDDKKLVCGTCCVSTCKNHDVITLDVRSDHIVKGLGESLKSIDEEISNLKNIATNIDVKFQEQFGHSSSKSHMADYRKVEDVKK